MCDKVSIQLSRSAAVIILPILRFNYDGIVRIKHCNCCGATFSSESDAIAHCTNSMSCYTAGYSGSLGWDETVEVLVPYTYEVCSECGAVKGN